ncbi:hypothetical protein Tco_0628628 [Tanacetum coccineum]|uniref:Uncharacterized protein n=1 Tax=Tanacetum coccineum TaxID=301880 RepID=A0ABQ4WQW7_9ASTR
MSTSTTHQQSLADAGSETRPPMLERDNYIPRASRFRRYLDQKRENKKWLNKAIDEVERLMRGTVQNQVDMETRCTNKFDKFVVEPRETLYVTQIRLVKRLTKDTYDDLFDYLYQYEQLVNASRAKKLEKSHEPLALMAYTGPSSRHPSAYYVTRPASVVDYDDDYQGDEFQNNSEDPLTSAMMLLARSITQRFSNPTNNRLRTSFNTRNQAIVQADRVNIQRRNSGNDGRNT